MEIHKPHAAKSWPEFFVEIGTIICGILVALGLEQAIEWVHTRHIAQEAREAIYAEVRENLWWLERRTLSESCIRERISGITGILEAARKGRPFPVIRHIGLLPRGKVTTGRWQANSQAGRASLFTAEEQRYLGNVYFTTEMYLNAQEREEGTWSRLRALEGLDGLTPEEVTQFSMLLADAKFQNYVATLSVYRAHQWAERLHLTADMPDVERLHLHGQSSICRPLEMPVDAHDAGSDVDPVTEMEDQL